MVKALIWITKISPKKIKTHTVIFWFIWGFSPFNGDHFQLRLQFFSPSIITIVIGVITQEEWHQPLVCFIPGQLTDVQATCAPGTISTVPTAFTVPTFMARNLSTHRTKSKFMTVVISGYLNFGENATTKIQRLITIVLINQFLIQKWFVK